MADHYPAGATLLAIGVLGPCLATSLPGQDWGVFHDSQEAEDQDELHDGQILQDVLFSISEWKDRQQRKIMHQLFHSRKRRDEEVTCYGDLGCFRDEGPFNYLDMLPSPPEEIGTVFYLFTRRNEELPQVLEYNNITTVVISHFNASSPTKVIIHGFGSSCTKVWAREMRLSFLHVEDCNVICVDWAAGAVDPNYVRAAVNTRLVGKQVALLVKTVNKEFGDINNKTHLVGFSLGAHVSGFVGKELRNLSRITGLDPAGPLFEGYSPKVRLDKTDADYVDVIHSNGDSLIIGGLGAWEPIGHVDFYPNGGKAQRGCQNLLIGGLYDFIYSYSTKNESYRYLCNHRRAYKLFTDSISPKCKFTAFPCDSYEKFETGQCFSCNSEANECGELGYYSNLSPGRGSLYLLTREEEPFCANQFKINLMFTGSRLPLYSYGALQIKLINHNGINETFSLTSTHDELLTSGAKIEKLIVAHPALDRPVEVQILYIAYEGWIYSGRYQWSVDKLTITDGFGKQLSFCKDQGELLPNGVPVSRGLTLGDCTNTPHKDLTALGEKVQKKPPLSPGQRPFLQGDSSKLSHLPGDIHHPKLSPLVTDLPPISHDLVLQSGGHQPSLASLADFDPELDLTTVPKPLLLPLEQQAILNLPGKPGLGQAQNIHKYLYGINNSIKKVSQGQSWKTKYPVAPGPPLQPHHLSGPPGAWSIVTSAPGSLPPPIHLYQSKYPTGKPGNYPNNGIELQFGPKFPLLPPRSGGLPPHNPFPARRRPSVGGPLAVHPPARPWGPQDMIYAGSETTLSVAPQPTTTETPPPSSPERNDLLLEEEIIIIDSSEQRDRPANNSQQPITNDDILSDDGLAIFKVGPDNAVERVVNMTSFDHNVTNNELTNYKYVILHKLPNGEALNLENLKTYNYEDLINDYKDQFTDDGLASEEFDRENLEYFDVPRRFSENHNPYIIYQLNDAASKASKDPPSKKFLLPPPGVRPVYKPTTERIPHPPNSYSHAPPRKSPVFVPPSPQLEGETLPLSTDDMRLLQTKVEQILSHPGPPARRPPPPQPANDWIPRDTDYSRPPHRPAPPHIDLAKLSQLSQLASVSIADAGSLAETVRSLRSQSGPPTSPHRPGRLTIQLLPPRLSAVLTHLEAPQAPRQELARAIHSGSHRQNKVSPAFQPRGREGGGHQRREHGRSRSSGEEYVLTHPYQTQVIPKERRSRFIPLGPPAPGPVPWWHPGQPSLVARREHQGPQGHHHPNHGLPGPLRPVRLPARKDWGLTSSLEWAHSPPYSQRRVGGEARHTVASPGQASGGLLAHKASLVRNLQKINSLEQQAGHLQKPFLPKPASRAPHEVVSPVSGGDTHQSGAGTQQLWDGTQAAGGDTQPAGDDTQHARDDTQAAGGDTQPAEDDTQAAGGDTQAAGDDTQAAGGDTQPAGGDTQAAGGDTQAAGGDTQPAGGDTKQSRNGTQQSGSVMAEEAVHRSGSEESGALSLASVSDLQHLATQGLQDIQVLKHLATHGLQDFPDLQGLATQGLQDIQGLQGLATQGLQDLHGLATTKLHILATTPPLTAKKPEDLHSSGTASASKSPVTNLTVPSLVTVNQHSQDTGDNQESSARATSQESPARANSQENPARATSQDSPATSSSQHSPNTVTSQHSPATVQNAASPAVQHTKSRASTALAAQPPSPKSSGPKSSQASSSPLGNSLQGEHTHLVGGLNSLQGGYTPLVGVVNSLEGGHIQLQPPPKQLDTKLLQTDQ